MSQYTLSDFNDTGDETDDISDGYVCPTCGRADFKSERGVKNHQTVIHEEGDGKVEVECAACGVSNRVTKWRAEEHNRNFCDAECRGEWLSENQTGKDAPNWKGGKVEIECTACGETAERKKDKVKRAENVFCSRSCFGEWLSQDRTGEGNPSWKGGLVNVSCEYCGSSFKVYPSAVSGRYGNFCNRECYGMWVSENLTGEMASNWEGGYSEYYGPSWPTQRRAAISRDNEQCVLCNLPRDSHYELYDQDLHVHHITPFRTFGVEDHEQANDLDNLITVCRSCHYQLEPVSQTRADSDHVPAE